MRSGQGRGVKKSMTCGVTLPSAGRGIGSTKVQSSKEFLPSQNGIGKKVSDSDDIEIFHTDTLIKEVYEMQFQLVLLCMRYRISDISVKWAKFW